ncbi:hypothetical protein GCM10022238_38700 [Gordonia hankookensis]
MFGAHRRDGVGEKQYQGDHDHPDDADTQNPTSPVPVPVSAPGYTLSASPGRLVNSETRHWRYSVTYRAHVGKAA